jgi:hypothetical protein
MATSLRLAVSRTAIRNRLTDVRHDRCGRHACRKSERKSHCNEYLFHAHPPTPVKHRYRSDVMLNIRMWSLREITWAAGSGDGRAQLAD